MLQGIKLIDFDDFMQQGFQKPGEALPPKPMDLACIQYTSGTTGELTVLTRLLHLRAFAIVSFEHDASAKEGLAVMSQV